MSRRNIFLADDDIEDQEILKEAILKLDPSAKFVAASNGQDAYDYLISCPPVAIPGLIILDYKMPLMNAVDILRLLYTDDRYAQVPKIVWSSSSQPQHIAMCRQNGAADYFTKPNHEDALNAIARRLLAYMA